MFAVITPGSPLISIVVLVTVVVGFLFFFRGRERFTPTPKAVIPIATVKAAPKATPKAAPKATPKATPKAVPKATPKAVPKATFAPPCVSPTPTPKLCGTPSASPTPDPSSGSFNGKTVAIVAIVAAAAIGGYVYFRQRRAVNAVVNNAVNAINTTLNNTFNDTVNAIA